MTAAAEAGRTCPGRPARRVRWAIPQMNALQMMRLARGKRKTPAPRKGAGGCCVYVLSARLKRRRGLFARCGGYGSEDVLPVFAAGPESRTGGADIGDAVPFCGDGFGRQGLSRAHEDPLGLDDPGH